MYYQGKEINRQTGSRGDCPFVVRSTDMTVGELKVGFPVDDFCKLVRLMDTGWNQNLLYVPESQKLSSKNTGTFWYNQLSIKAVIPYILLACQNHRHSGVAYGHHKKSVATASRSR